MLKLFCLMKLFTISCEIGEVQCISQTAHLWWTNAGPIFVIRWPNVGISGLHHVVLADGRNVGSPMAGWFNVDPPFESVVGPTSYYLVDFQRWTHGCAMVGPMLAKMVLDQQLLPTLGQQACPILISSSQRTYMYILSGNIYCRCSSWREKKEESSIIV